MRLAILSGVLISAIAMAQAPERADFATVDTDNDGKLSAAEFRAQFVATARARAQAGYPKAQRFTRMPADQQAQVLDRLFARFDGNADGSIDAAEWQATEQDPQFRGRPRTQGF